MTRHAAALILVLSTSAFVEPAASAQRTASTSPLQATRTAPPQTKVVQNRKSAPLDTKRALEEMRDLQNSPRKRLSIHNPYQPVVQVWIPEGKSCLIHSGSS